MISVIIPSKNEAESLSALFDEIADVLKEREFEIVVVDDGSTDDTGSVLATEARKRDWPLRHVRHEDSTGKSMALRSGAWAAQGSIVVTVDGDGQNDPRYILPLVDALEAGGPETGIAVGQRLKREDGNVKRYASRFANGLRRRVLHDRTRDTACGLKAVRTDIFRKLPFFEGCHRFLPALVIQEGYDIVHCDVIDRVRAHGKSHYGILDRGMHGVLDLLGVWWLGRRRRRMPREKEIFHD